MSITVPSPRQTDPPLVLVADDDLCALDVQSAALRRAGYAVIEAVTLEQLLLLARTKRPAAIVFDVVMESLEGWRALMLLRSDDTTAHIPVIVSSIQDDEENGRLAGACAFLFKPVSTPDLLGSLSERGIFPRVARVA